MALNLWKLGGKPTSYNPLDNSYNNRIILGLGQFVISFNAKSISGNGYLSIEDDGSPDMVPGAIRLTPTLTKYTFSLNNTLQRSLYLRDFNNLGDIIIDSIELVQKPLPKLTLNGVDGFNSGKWTITPTGVIVDDETAIINATNTTQNIEISFPIDANIPLVFSLTQNTGRIYIDSQDVNGVQLSRHFGDSPLSFFTFTTHSNAKKIRIVLSSGSLSTGTLMFKRPMLNLGNVAAPYSRKTGDKMVMPTPKKNLLPSTQSDWEIGSGGVTTPTNDPTRIRCKYPLVLKKDVTYSMSFNSALYDIFIFDNGTGVAGWYTSNFQFTVTDGAKTYIVARRKDITNVNLSEVDALKPQLEEGSIITSYEPYNVKVNKKPKRAITKARTGLAFNKSGNIAVPYTFTRKGALEVDFTPLSVDYNFNTIFDNSVDGNTFEMWIYASGQLAVRGNSSATRNTGSDYLMANTRYLVRWEWDADLGTQNLYVNDKLYSSIFVWSTPGNTLYLNGGASTNTSGNNTFYSLKIWDGNGVLTNSYDFENPSNIVGNSVLPNANNLIPSFEDARWSLQSSGQVLGKDTFRCGSGLQSIISGIPVTPNAIYLAVMYGNGRMRIGKNDSPSGAGSFIHQVDVNSTVRQVSFTVPSDTTSLKIALDSNSVVTGTFDFIKPQLYALSGTEGTLNGTPTQLNRTSKRTLYAKR